MQNNVCYVVLHFKTKNSTIKTVKSIIDFSGQKNVNIVIVDNGSNDYSFNDLREIFSNQKNIQVINTGRNLGFAKGNNFGIDFAKKWVDPDFIVVMNNDVYLLTYNFNLKINSIFERTNFSVLGPKIYLNDGDDSSNPMSRKLLKNREINILIIKRIIKLAIFKIKFDFMLSKSKNISIKESNDEQELDIQLHGAVLIFSRNYFKFYNGFYPGTFLYFEEYFIYENIKHRNLVSVYSPEIEVLHDEDTSTNSLFNQERKKVIFVLKNEIKSLLKLKRYKKELNI